MADLYSLLKDKVKDLANVLVTLPESNVWVHEKATYNLIGLKRSNKHGKREVLTFLLQGIQRGIFGNKKKKDCVPLGYSIPNISNDSEENDFNIYYQQYGRNEEFLSGTLDDKPILSKPRWFRRGDTLTDVKTQIEIVNALIGEKKGLPADVAIRRRQYYKCFVSGDKEDGGYGRRDVPTIIGEYEQIWSKIVGSKSNTRNGVQRRYELKDRQKIEDILKLMIVASNTCGKLKVEDGLLLPSNSMRRGRGDGLDSTTAMPTAVTPAAGKTNAAAKPTPKAITFTPDVKEARGGRLSSRNNNDGALRLQYITCTNSDGDISMKKVSELASLELLFHLYSINYNLQDCNEAVAAAAAERDMKRLNVKLPETFDYNNLQLMSSQQVNKSNLNIKNARINLVENLNGHFVPREDCLLYEWLQDGRSYSRGCAVQTTSNFQQGAYNKHQISITLSAVWILRHIVYSHNLPLRTALMLWAEYHVLILRRPIRLEWFICERTLWNHIHRLSFIDNALATKKFHSFIRQRSPNGFLRYFYSSSDDSKHNKQNRHVVLVSTNTNSNTNDIQPGFRHVTSSVNELKSNSAQHNAEQIISMLGLHCAAHYGGGTNDNAPDAQKEIFATFDKIMDAAKADEDIRDLLYENGVLRRAIRFGDPYHIANLAVMWASEVAFGGTENADHTQVHHRQLLQSIHSLHTDDKPLSQAYLDEVMEALSFVIKSKRERQQRWLVNQRNARATLDMYYKLTEAGNSSLVEWALKFANESKSDWKRRVGGEIATWLSMPSIILGLHFESELGNYFEEIYAWHCRPGPLNSRPGFRMLELYDLYFGFEVPWWNEAVANPETKLPETMKYLEDNFHGDELVFRKSQIMRGLKKGRDEMIKMSSKYLLQPPIMFILLTHREYGGPFLRYCDNDISVNIWTQNEIVSMPSLADRELVDYAKSRRS